MNRSDKKKNSYMLQGRLARRGFVRWFHSFRGIQPESGDIRTFFVEYQIINPGMGGDSVKFGAPARSGKKPSSPSYLMIKAGVLPSSKGDAGMQLSSFHPINSIQFCSNPFLFQSGECFYSEDHLHGCVEVTEKESRHPRLLSDAGTIEWNLDIHKAVACNMGFITDPICCALGALKSFWHAEGLRTYYKGTVSLNGTLFRVDPSSCYGYSDKNWGKKIDRPFLSFASSHLVSTLKDKEYKNSAFAVRGCFPKLFFLSLKPKLMIQLTHNGEDFEFHFASVRNLSRCKWDMKTTNKRYIWHIKAQNKNAVIRISISSTKRELMELLYGNMADTPLDFPVFCSGAGEGTIKLYRRNKKKPELLDSLRLKDILCTCSL